MATLVARATTAEPDTKALKIIARSLFKELKLNGYDTRAIVNLTTELISLVTLDLRGDAAPPTVR